jgi:hypothetical protein
MIVKQRNQPFGVRHFGVVLMVWAGAAGAQAEPRIIDRAVASIEGRVITASQLQFEARVLLIAAGGTEAAFAPLDPPALAAGLSAMVDQRLALLEADKLDAYQLEPGELERAIAQFRGRFASEEKFARFLAEHEADLSDLSEILRRSLRAERALEGKLRLRAQVTEAEARTFRAEHSEFKDVGVDRVRAMLVQRRFGELVRKELAGQRRQVDVRLLGPFAPKAVQP